MPPATPITVDDRFRALIEEHGLAKTASLLGRRYASVRAAAKNAGIAIKRGRRRTIAADQRDREIFALRRDERLFLIDIGRRYGLGRERVRQVLERLGGDPLQTVVPEEEVAAREKRVVALRRRGHAVADIAEKVQLTPAYVRRVILRLPHGDPLKTLGHHINRPARKATAEAVAE
jgi:hypothetical protein